MQQGWSKMTSPIESVGTGFERRRNFMQRRGAVCALGLCMAFAFLAGCHGDPNVRKQKYLDSGKRYSEAGKYNEAVIQFSNALKIDKSYPEAHYELSKTYMHMGQIRIAYSELMYTVTLQPSNYKARLDLGNLLLAGGRIDEAQAQADAVKAMQPNSADLHALLAGIAGKKGLRGEAMKEIQNALAIEPNRAAFHEDLALLEGSDPSKSSAVEDELKKSVTLDPKSTNARMLLSDFYAANKRWPESEQAARDAIQADPASLRVRNSLAQLYLRESKQADAEEVYRQTTKDLSDNPAAVRVLADYFERSGQAQKARAEYQTEADKYPKNLPLQEGYIRSLLEVGDETTAIKTITDLVKKNPKDPQVLALNGIVLLRDNKPADAENFLMNAAKEYPKDSFILFWLGRAALAKGDTAQAETSLRQSTSLAPGRVDAQAELARIAVMRGDMNLLGSVADSTIAAVPRFPGGYVWRAVVEMSRNVPEKAEADLKTAMTLSLDSAPAYLQMGKLRFMQRKFPEGVALLEQALDRDPNSIEAMRMLVGYDVYMKQPDKAEGRVAEQIAKSPNNSFFYDLLASLQAQDKKLDLATATAQKAMAINSSDGDAVSLYAQIQVLRGQTGNAVGVWEQWAKVHRTDAGALAVLGMLEESRSNRPKAENYYKRALQIQPLQAVAANNLAYMMLMNGENADVALTLAQTARRSMPNSPSTADTLAWAYYTKGAYGFARDLLEEATKEQANDSTMEYHLGMVYSRLANRSAAITHLKKAISLAPTSPTAKDAQEALQAIG
jgi:tetratricopeptide (TPR) repeat protein